MKFTTIREDKNHRVHVTNRSEEWFIEKIQKDTATGLMKGYRHFLSYSSGIGSYLRMSEIPSLCMSCELRRSNEGQPEFGRWNVLVTLEVHELGSEEACDAALRRCALHSGDGEHRCEPDTQLHSALHAGGG